MKLHRVYGHDALRNRLEGTIASGRFPQSTLLTGSAGIGKQRLALWLAQALLCEVAQSTTVPCGNCRGCKQVDGLAHPDLHWFVPIQLAKRSGDPAKQIEEAEDVLGEIMAERREAALYRPADGQAGHPLASVRLLQRRVAVTPFQARRKVVIVGDADRLIVQEASQEAANALLKVLEEPPADTTLILTTSSPELLLPTIRSRVVPIRVSAMTTDAVRALLVDEAGMSETDADRWATLSEGSVGRALELADSADDGFDAAERFLAGVRRGEVVWAEHALLQARWGARGGFTAVLDGLSLALRRRLQEVAGTQPGAARAYVDGLRRLEEHRNWAQGNVNPQLAAAVIAAALAELP